MLEVDDITIDERHAIEELRKRIEHELPPRVLEDKSFYYRNLKARDFNLKKAESLVRRHLAIRKLNEVDKILEKYDPPQGLDKYSACCHIGYDKEGSTIRYCDFGGADLKGILSAYTFKQICQHAAILLEDDLKKMTEQSKKRGKSITKFNVIFDMDRLNLFSVTFKKAIDTMKEGFTMFQDFFPERIKSVYIINASRYFYIIYAMVNTILASALLQKIHIFGRDGWKEALLEIAEADQLPMFLGGSRTDPDGDPYCPSFVVRGIPVPEELYLKKKKSTLACEKDVKKLVVTRFSLSEIFLNVNEPNSLLEWEFETKNRDIGFGLYYRNTFMENEIIEELVPKQRIDTMLSSETGVYKCDKPGTYIIVFDNSYSWIFSKEIYYRIHLIKPKFEKYNTD